MNANSIIDLVDRPAFSVVGITLRAGWKDLWTEMPLAWTRFHQRADAIVGRVGPALDITLEGEGGVYTQLLCHEVPELLAIPEGMIAVRVPAQSYVHLRHTGTLPEIASSFGVLYEWAEENGHRTDEFKLDVGYTADGSELGHDLFVRVLPGASWKEVAL